MHDRSHCTGAGEPKDERFFVTIYARDRTALNRLAGHELDLVYGSARGKARSAATIEGLLTLDEVGRLVEDGYAVLVQEEVGRRARARREIVSFPEWIEAWRKDLEK